MEYTSTRDAALRATGAQAIVQGLAPGGGLFVPVDVPKVDIEALQGKSYEDVAFSILNALLPEWEDAALRQSIMASYGPNFNNKAGYLAKVNEGLYSLELWHGPTAAFKDYALQLMPRLLVQAKEICGDAQKTLILVATSGDTGKAALEGYKDVPGTGICVFYPDQGTSEVQRLQMVTQQGGNVAVYAVQGNFDDAQQGVKKAFGNADLAKALAEKGIRLSSANSINWGRLAPQIVYYAATYLQLVKKEGLRFGQPVDYCVPTGNFGDILAGYYAKQMGVPVGRLICASNQNNVLSDFIETGVYNARRAFHKTSSPSMDILVSSNLERLLFHASGDAKTVGGWMAQLAETGQYTVGADVLAKIREHFDAGWAGEEAVSREIRAVYEENNYLCDPHTAVGFHVLKNIRRDTARPAVVLSTASPYKFGGKVLSSLGQPVPSDEFEALAALQQICKLEIPEGIASLSSLPVRFGQVVAPKQIEEIPLELSFL